MSGIFPDLVGHFFRTPRPVFSLCRKNVFFWRRQVIVQTSKKAPIYFFNVYKKFLGGFCMAIVGYKRVSTYDQITDRQLDGLELDEIFEDKLSGKDTNRPGLENCIQYLRKGDQLTVHSIDRLARNLRDLQDLVEKITEEKGADILFVKEGLKFSGGEKNPMQELQLHLMGAFAQFERAIIRERQKEGIAIALKKGVRFGRPVIQWDPVRLFVMLQRGKTKKDAARALGVSRATVYNFLKGLDEQEERKYRRAALDYDLDDLELDDQGTGFDMDGVNDVLQGDK